MLLPLIILHTTVLYNIINKKCYVFYDDEQQPHYTSINSTAAAAPCCYINKQK